MFHNTHNFIYYTYHKKYCPNDYISRCKNNKDQTSVHLILYHYEDIWIQAYIHYNLNYLYRCNNLISIYD